jgi:DNA primase catalytic core
MEISAIKERLAMETVLRHYGLQPDRQHRLLCPFHNDTTPSLQIYPKTNTWCCFSTNCAAGTGDVIQFIQLKENCTKHQAIVKAKELISGGSNPSVCANNNRQGSSHLLGRTEENMDRIAVLTKVFSYFKVSLPRTKKAVDYLAGRLINYQQHEIGYNSGGLHTESKNHHLVESMVKCGLLKPRAAQGYIVWAKDCVIFPLKNRENKIVSLYGRSIINDEESRHFYLQNREGLYPHYPKAETARLIITESVIDAASLLQQKAITDRYEILSLYGTNGLTEEHQQAIVSLEHLQEIIFMLDGDAAGRAAAQKHYGTLSNLLPAIKITHVELPDGEDINSLLETHEDPEVLLHLIEERKPVTQSKADDFFLSNEKEKSPDQLINRPLPGKNKLNTANAELLLYNDDALYIEILGGIRITGLDRMKVTLKILHKETTQLPVWHSLDLYQHEKREQLINHIADAFDIGTTVISNTIAELIKSLEAYRLQKIESLQQKPQTQPEMTAAQRQVAVTELQKPNLLERTSQMIALSGIVGETTNSLIAYLVYCTRKQQIPLHVMFLGSSGSGKTYLQEKISELIPDEDKIEITQITENALYYFKQHELEHKLILIEDLDGALTVFYPLRELQTKRRISKTVTLKDSKGNLKTITLTVEGPVCVSGCTTKEKIYEDNANRCLLLYIDQTREQDKKVTEYQTKSAAGEINKQREQQYRELFKNIQRVLQPVKVINPYAKYIELPEQVFKPRRTMTLLLGFIEAITFYHQYQREVKRDENNQSYITTTIADIEAAFTLLKEVLFSKSDELTNATRQFLENLKVHINNHQVGSFKTQDIRKTFRLPPRNIQRYMKELHQYGYIKRLSSQAGRAGYEYSITNPGEYEQLQSAVDHHLQSILNNISAVNATMRQ